MAAGPHGTKSPTSRRDDSMDRDEPQWRTNSSFSPPPLRIWDCRLHSDGLSHGSNGAGLHGSSLSSNSKGSRSRVGSGGYVNHHHSVSDGALSYSGSPPDGAQVPRWTSPIQRFNQEELPAPNVGGNLKLISLLSSNMDVLLIFDSYFSCRLRHVIIYYMPLCINCIKLLACLSTFSFYSFPV